MHRARCEPSGASRVVGLRRADRRVTPAADPPFQQTSPAGSAGDELAVLLLKTTRCGIDALAIELMEAVGRGADVDCAAASVSAAASDRRSLSEHVVDRTRSRSSTGDSRRRLAVLPCLSARRRTRADGRARRSRIARPDARISRRRRGGVASVGTSHRRERQSTATALAPRGRTRCMPSSAPPATSRRSLRGVTPATAPAPPSCRTRGASGPSTPARASRRTRPIPHGRPPS